MLFEQFKQSIRDIQRKLRYSGKFYGYVTENKDPENKGRIKIEMKSVFGDHQTDWAIPQVPFSGNGYGFSFIPEIGDKVIVEFINFDVNSPIYTGMTWQKSLSGDNQVIPDESSEKCKVLQTKSGNILKMDDENKEIELKRENISGISIKDDKIVLKVTDNNKIELNENLSIKIDSNCNIECGGDCNIKATNTNVEATMVNFKSAITIGEIAVPPIGFCALPACIFSGVPHTTNVFPG